MRGLIARTASGLLALGALANAAAASAEERLAVAGGCATEIVFALGAGERIVGVDTTSNWPPEARDLPRFGYLRTLPVEGILALKPDRLLTTAEAGPPSSIERLSKAMPVDVLPVMRTPRELPEQVRRVARQLSLEERGETLAAELEARLASIPTEFADEPAPEVLLLLAPGGERLMAGGAGTSADALLQSLGLRNAARGMDSFKPLSREALLQSEANLIVVAETAPGAFQPENWPALARTPAGRAGRVLVRDSMYLLGFGPRVVEAMAELRAAATNPEFAAWKRD